MISAQYLCTVYYDKKDIPISHEMVIEPVLSMGAECIFNATDEGLLLKPAEKIEYPLGYSFYTEDEDPFSFDQSRYQICFYKNARQFKKTLSIDHVINHDPVAGDSIVIQNISSSYVWFNRRWSIGHIVVEPIAFISFIERTHEDII